jgi:hypothetical protein
VLATIVQFVIISTSIIEPEYAVFDVPIAEPSPELVAVILESEISSVVIAE